MGTKRDFTVYAMKLQPGGAEDWTDPFEFCREEGIIGVGWAIDDENEYETFDEVYEAHEEVVQRRTENGKKTERILNDGRLKAPLRYILREIDVGDYVWVNEKNQFVLCKVQSGWEVTSNLPEEKCERYKSRDIQHFRHADWVDIPYPLVPGYVRRKFSRSFGTATEMKKGINADSRQILASLHARDDIEADGSLDRELIAEKIESAELKRVFDILGPTETEDIVISYLQSEGWRIIKSSTSSSEAKIECEMRTEKDSTSVLGYLQVKTGSASLDPEAYEEYADAGRMIFFVESRIDVANKERMSAITPEELHEYMVENHNYLPYDTLLKLDFSLRDCV